MVRLILASQSPHRLELLRGAGFDVESFPAPIDEPEPASFADLEAGLACIAHCKAREAARRGARGLILAADTVGHSGGTVFGKPRDRDHALAMLRAISGTTHEVLTGWCLLQTRGDLALVGTERTQITMRDWSEAEYAAWLDSGQWVDASGAYRLQLLSDPFVTRLEGSAANVVGVPIERIKAVLSELPGLSE